MKNLDNIKVIISGGGTGGHIYPAIAIAKEIIRRYPSAQVKFVGALGRMEMEKVPKAGFAIVGLPISGIQRSLSLKNLLLPFKLIKSLMMARSIIKNFGADAAIGVGGYASGPLLWMANVQSVPTLIQEQNSFAGLTNKWLSSKVARICVAYDGMEKYFPKEKIVLTGNPVRQDIIDLSGKKELAVKHFGLDISKPTILVIGGSLGARTINESIDAGLKDIDLEKYNLIWQTGKWYFEKALSSAKELKGMYVKDFIYEMDLAYAMADVVVSRAGALSVSELALAGKPTIFVPSPNVSEDHQTKNAMALVNKDAAVLVKDVDAKNKLLKLLNNLLDDEIMQRSLSANIKNLSKPNATIEIVDQLEKILVK